MAAGTKLQALLVGDGPLAAAVRTARNALDLEGTLHLAGHRGDAEALGAAIAGLCADAGRRAAMGAAAMDRVRRFGVAQTAEGRLAVYRRVLAR